MKPPKKPRKPRKPRGPKKKLKKLKRAKWMLTPFIKIGEFLNTYISIDTATGKLLAMISGATVGAILGVPFWIIGHLRGMETLTQFGSFTLIFSFSILAVSVALYAIIWGLNKTSFVDSLVVKTGVRQTNQISTGGVAVIAGLVISLVLVTSVSYLLSIILTLSPWYALISVRATAVTYLLVWLGFTGLLLYTFKEINQQNVRTDLAIVNVHEYEKQPRELVVRNTSDETVDLRKAKIEDSNGNLYQLSRDNLLRPNETGTYRIPNEFDLEAVNYQVPFPLNMFYSERKTSAIYSREGEMFTLEWTGTGEPEPEPTTSRRASS